MTAPSYGRIRSPFERVLALGWPAALTALCILLTSCGSAPSAPSAPSFSGNTLVTVALSSAANDQLSEFSIGFTGISLTNQAGQTVNLLNESDTNQQFAEFIHLNGSAEPLVTSSIPQGIYTAATVAVGDTSFTCVTLASSGGLAISIFAYGATLTNAPATTVTVNLASPITITGTSMGLLLNLQVAQSAAYSSCYDPSGNYTYSITPTFDLTPITFSSQPTSAQNGKVTALDAEVTALNIPANSLTLSLPGTPSATARTLLLTANGDTLYQGVSNFSALADGMFVDIDGAIQEDGSLLATRIAVEDQSAVDVLIGSVLQTGPNEPAIPEPNAVFLTRFSEGPEPIPDAWDYGFSSATFQISGQVNNLQSLPFPAVFDASHIVPGQNAYVTSKTVVIAGGVDPPASTITLMPQTIDGTVTASSQSGKFAVYSVTLASYDLFPMLAMQPVQLAVLNDPGKVEVYVDSSARLLNNQPLAVGGTLRFYGLMFNDNGTLRMDCSQVSDGVPETPPANSSMQAPMVNGRVTSLRVSSVGQTAHTMRLITPAQ